MKCRILIIAVALLLPAGCGGGGEQTSGDGATGAGPPDPPGQSQIERVSADRLRDLVVRGFAEEFRSGTGAGPKGYATCVRNGLRRELTREQLRGLLAVHRRPDGGPSAARALGRIAGSLGKACGGARFMPEMVAASAALTGVRISEPAASRMGISYGPFIGLACRVATSARCDEVGIDLVLKHEARSVEATLGGRRLKLRTPGLNSGARDRDWVGYLEHVGLERPGSPFFVPRRAGNPRRWAGEPPVHVPVRLAIEYPGGRRVVHLPHVSLSPGWG